MAPHIHNRERPVRGTLFGVVMIIFGIFACSAALLVGVDFACQRDIDTWMPVYPGSEVVSEDYNFLRPRAMGISTVRYTTPDDVDTVRSWYGEYRRQLTNSMSSPESTAARGLANTRYQFVENPDGDGTFIIHSSECAYD